MRTRRCVVLALALFCLFPAVVMADGVSPVLNLFHKDTWLPATLVTILIVLVESALLRLRIKEIRYLDTLWRCIVLNLVSSITGSVILVGLGRDSYFMWDTMSLVFPLFLVTVVTEIPMLRLLYRKLPLSWERACTLGIGINIASYAVVFVAEIGLLLGFLSFAGRSDEKDRTQWVHPELLAQSVGKIYATEEVSGGSHRLRVLDTTTKSWRSLTNCPSLDPNQWDVEGRTCAFVRWSAGISEREIAVVAPLPEFSPMREITVSGLRDTNYDRNSNWQGISDLSLSPDRRKLAVLFHVTDAVAYRDNSSYFDLGGKCALAVFAVDSGQQIIRASRWASDRGLCWFPDSSALLFTSLKDEGVYKTTKAEVCGHTSYGAAYAKGDRFKMGLFYFNITNGEVRWFAEGEEPTVSVGSRQFMVRDDNKVCIVDTQGASRACEGISRLDGSRAVLSPCGKMMLAQISRHQPFFAGGRLTVVDLAQPSLRHIIASDLVYRFKWTMGGGEAASTSATSSP